MNLSGNELGIIAVERILDKLGTGFQLDSLILHTNNLGEKFSTMKSRWTTHSYVDLGSERFQITDVIS